jgi:hypothetical protein
VTVLTFANEFPARDALIGGVSLRPHVLMRELAARGARVHVVVLRGSASRSDLPGVEVTRLRVPAAGPQREIALFPAILTTFLRERRVARASGRRLVLYQMVHPGLVLKWGVVPIHVSPGSLLFPLARRLGVTTWAGMHDLAPDHQQASLRRRRASGLEVPAAEARAIERAARFMAFEQHHTLRRADIVTTVSQGMTEAVVARHRVDPAHIVRFDAGVDADIVAGIPPWRPPADRPWRIGYLGSVADADFSVLEAGVAGLLPEEPVEILLGGAGADVTLAFPVPVRPHPVVRYVDFGAFAGGIDIWAIPYGDDPYYRTMAAQLKLPMDVASGRPVVVTATAELRRSPLGGFVELAGPGPDGFADALARVMKDPAGAQRRAVAGREYVLRELTWSATVERLLADASTFFDAAPIPTTVTP